MKKLVLVMICTLIMTIFIAFNYLLWDRENKIKSFENINDSKTASIDALGSEIKKLNETNRELNSRVNSLINSNKELQSANYRLEQEVTKMKGTLSGKDEVIFRLKQQTDLGALEDVVKKWVDNIDKGQYQAANQLQLPQLYSQTAPVSTEDFERIYRSTIKSMKIKSIKLNVEDVPNDSKGKIQFKVTLDIKKADDSGKSLFDDGPNERFFTIGYSVEKNNWVITDISDSP